MRVQLHTLTRKAWAGMPSGPSSCNAKLMTASNARVGSLHWTAHLSATVKRMSHGVCHKYKCHHTNISLSQAAAPLAMKTNLTPLLLLRCAWSRGVVAQCLQMLWTSEKRKKMHDCRYGIFFTAGRHIPALLCCFYCLPEHLWASRVSRRQAAEGHI